MHLKGNMTEHAYDVMRDRTTVKLEINGHYDSHEIINHLRHVNTHNMGITRVIFNDPATVVFWHDGTKTVVKCQDGDTFDEETGLLMCIAKKVYGNTGTFNDVLKKWCGSDGKHKPTAYIHFDKNGNRIYLTDLCKYYDGTFFSVVAFADGFIVGTLIDGDISNTKDRSDLFIFLPQFCEDMEYDHD